MPYQQFLNFFSLRIYRTIILVSVTSISPVSKGLYGHFKNPYLVGTLEASVYLEKVANTSGH